MIIVLKKKTAAFIAAAIIVVLTATLFSVFFFRPHSATVAAERRKLPVYSVERDDKYLAISFDAAWGADKTQGIIDCLVEHNAKATFFLTGFWIEDYPDMVRAIDAAGMEIGNHSANHLMNTGLAADKLNEEISSVNDMIVDLTGKKPLFYRCPFGDYNNNVISAVENQGMIAVQWSVDSLDWKGLSAGELTDRILSRATEGSIILCHNNSDHILEALPIILEELTGRGYRFVTMSKLVYTEDYYIDSQGKQKKGAQPSVTDDAVIVAELIEQ